MRTSTTTAAEATPAPIFLDTNILVYATSPASPFHAAALAGLRVLAAQGRPGVISTQVVREYYGVLTRPDASGIMSPVAPVLANIARFQAAYTVLEDTQAVLQTLLTLVQTTTVGGRQIHDANLVALMVTYGINDLYTHNGAHFARFGMMITITPLR